jgi:hypothetical protein
LPLITSLDITLKKSGPDTLVEFPQPDIALFPLYTVGLLPILFAAESKNTSPTFLILLRFAQRN